MFNKDIKDWLEDSLKDDAPHVWVMTAPTEVLKVILKKEAFRKGNLWKTL